MSKHQFKKPTPPTSAYLSDELLALADRMKVASHHLRYYDGMSAESQMRSRELSSVADIVYGWARQVAKEGKK